MKILVALVAAALSSTSPAWAQEKAGVPRSGVIRIDTSRLLVEGAVKTPLALTSADLAAMPRTAVKFNEEGGEAAYEGVLLSDILKKAGALTGEKLRGKALKSYIICEARDGYSVLLSLAEFDSDFNDNPVIVADKRDGQPLFEYQGPFRMVAPKDKRGARSIRMLSKLTVFQEAH